eukprot:529680_1
MLQQTSIVNMSAIDTINDGMASDSSLDNINNQIESQPLPAEIININCNNNKKNKQQPQHERIRSAFEETPGKDNYNKYDYDSSNSEDLFAINDEKNCILETPRNNDVMLLRDDNELEYWLRSYQLDSFYQTLLWLGFDKKEMFLKCSDLSIKEIAKQLKLHNMESKDSELAITLKLKTAITNLIKNNTGSQNTAQNAIENINKKINITQTKTMEITQSFENIENEKILLEQEIRNKLFEKIENK